MSSVAGLFFCVLVGYAALAMLSWQSFGAGLAPSFFPAAGLTVGAMMLSRRSWWPVIVAAIVLAEMSVDIFHGTDVAIAAGYALANTIEPLVGAWAALAWCGGVPDLRERSGLLRFLATACTLGPLAGGVVGGFLATVVHGTFWPVGIVHWWAGDGIGALVVGAPIILWPKQSHALQARWIEASIGLVSVAGLSWIAWWAEIPPTAVLLPLMAWSAFRLNVIGAVLAGAVVAFVTNFLTLTESAPLTGLKVDVASRLAMTQVFIAVIVLVGIVMAQEVAARTVAVNQREAELRERIRLESLARLAQSLAAALTPKQIGDAVIQQVLNDASAQALALGAISADGTTLEWVGISGYPVAVAAKLGSGIPLNRPTAVTDAIRLDEPIVIRSQVEYRRSYPNTSDWMTASNASSALAWPLKSSGKPLGALGLLWTQPQPLDAAQLAYVSAVTTIIGQALERARRYAAEHARAAVLQSAVLPTRPVNLPGLDFGVVYEPADVAQGLGGDWYDVTPLPSNQTFLAVGDVVGHGLPAVEDMAQLRSAGLALALQGLAPAQLLAELNTVTRHASHGKFATMMVAVWDQARGQFRYASAGHPPAFLRRGSTGEVVRLAEGRGPVLGPIEGAPYNESEIIVEKGDILVMYTDGLIERPGRDVESGMALVQRDVESWHADVSLSEGCRKLADMLAPAPRADDVCVVAIRVRPDATR